MIICPRKTSYEGTMSCPDRNWYDDEMHKDWLVVDETTEEGRALAKRIINAFPYFDMVIEDCQLVDITEWPEIYYSVEKREVASGEIAIITTEPNTVALIDGQEYLLEDGILEYSNDNVGKHVIELRKENEKSVKIEIEVV